MAYLIKAPCSIAALGNLLSLTLKAGDSAGDRIEFLSVLVNISSAEDLRAMEKFEPVYKGIVGTEFWDRAKQLYCSTESLTWKDSYRGRLLGINASKEVDQLRNIIRSLVKTPGANTLSFSFYRPSDHIRARAIPASMPCPLAGDFKYRHGQLHLNIFFRTQDVYRLAFPDMFFVRGLQRDILREMKGLRPGDFEGSDLGELNLFLSRAFVLKRHKNNAEQLLEAIDKFQGNQRRKNERRC